MKQQKIGADAVPLFPATEADLTIGVAPGDDDGIAVSIQVRTSNLGSFVIPVNKHQLGAIAGVANWLLKLTEQQFTDLRARLVRELEETEGNQK